ncbi:MAG TPA: hypothetical protein VGI81_04115 [Tepidisphaeraceae bacterium]|jgi:hypothetical protein
MSQVTSTPVSQVAKTIFVTVVDPSLTFSLVEYDDGRLDIFRNGEAISPSPWPTAELHNCVSTFRTISRIACSAARDVAGQRSSA